MNRTKKEYIQVGTTMGICVAISTAIIMIVALSTKKEPVIIGPDDSSTEIDNFNEFDAKESIFKLMQNQLILSGKNDDEVTDLLSISWNESNHSLNCSGYISDPINDLIISMDINLDESYTLDSVIKKFGSEEIKVTDYSIDSNYLLAMDSDEFITNSNYKLDFKEANVSYVGVTQDLNEDHYYYGTYKDGNRCISINGLKFDSTTYEYSKLNIAKTDVSINDAKHVYKLLYIMH